MLVESGKLIAAIDKLIGSSGSVAERFGFALKLLTYARARIEADGAWSSHTEELTRKATDTAHAVVFRLSEGTITQEAAHTALGAIIDSTSGLIDRDALDTLNEAYRSLRS